MQSRRCSLVVFLAFSILTACKSSNTIRLGCLAPLTGESANYGQSTREGVQLAVSEINAAHFLSKPLEIVYEDDRMDPRDGISAFRKLIDVDHVPAVIGPFGSSVVLACAPVANQTHTVIISASATADKIADAGDYVFRITPPNSKQGSDDADFSVHTLHAATAAVIFQNNDYGITLRDAFVSRFKALGGTIVDVESVDDGATDFRAQLTKIRQAKPAVIFFPEHYNEAALTLRQAHELGISSSFISADGAMTEDLLRTAGSAAEGTYYSTLALGYGVADKQIADFQTRFRAAYGHDPDVYAAYYYEVTKIVAQAIRDSGASGDAIKKGLYAITGANAYVGITGRTSFDSRGEVDKSFYVYVVKNGKFQLLHP